MPASAVFRKTGNQILGSDIAGRVEVVGRNVSQFQPGDDVFGEMMYYRGGFAEYACTSEKALVGKPAGMPFEVAAAIPQGAGSPCKGSGIRGRFSRGKYRYQRRRWSAGDFAMQLAKAYGAEVTGVDNTGKMDFMYCLAQTMSSITGGKTSPKLKNSMILSWTSPPTVR